MALTDAERSAGVLTDDEVLTVARLAFDIERHFGAPQDVEWCFDANGDVHVVQTRPITTLAGRPVTTPVPVRAASGGELLVRGLGASPGIAAGPVRVLSSPAEGGQLIAGEVLVAPMTNPDWLPTLRRAAAVVTDSGGVTCHAAIASRELGVPCIVGTHDATSRLHDGQEVTVDGTRGTVIAGAVDQPAALLPVAGSGGGERTARGGARSRRRSCT